MKVRVFLGLFSVLFCMCAHANSDLSVSEVQPVKIPKSSDETAGKLYSSSQVGTNKDVYIIELEDPAVANYTGNIMGFEATSPAVTGAQRLNVNAASSMHYKEMLEVKQQSFIDDSSRSFGRDLNVTHRFKYVLNGVAAELSVEEAKYISRLPNVKRIEKERFEKTLTDVGPQWMSAEAIWYGNEYAWPREVSSKGEGVVVAILDTGINSKHPAFADVGDDGYDHVNPLGEGNYIPGSYCDTQDASFCNDKIIGAWGFAQGPLDPDSPEDNDGHGSHVAATVAGNVIDVAVVDAPTTSLTRSMSGVAPHANIIAYDVCVDGGCPGSALLAAVEQVVIDASALPNGIQALNYSISGGGSPYDDVVELGFLNATAAGIYVSASAGNSGPGVSTLSHNGPWVATVGAATHNRKVINGLTDIQSDEGELEDIISVGFTAGYGPASIVYAGDYPTDNGSANDTDPAQCLEPFPAGHFNGEIVICDRGAIARTAKGENVLAGGAGGFVLVNQEANGEGVSPDAHFLPGVHLGFAAGQRLKDWLITQTNPVATISGYSLSLDDANGDIVADFSSRGPFPGRDLLKPDIVAPGVGILAAVNKDPDSSEPQYGFLSGTSMSSPHHAGAAALVSAIRPEWTPYEIKSALMMSAKNTGLVKEDGLTPADYFDIGAGRVDLSQIQHVDLVLDETPENFLAANPDEGGDLSSLNLASMQNANCVEKCSWTRRLKNSSDYPSIYRLGFNSPKGLTLRVYPPLVFLKPQEEIEIEIKANTVFAEDDWTFTDLELVPFGFFGRPDLHMPMAIKRSTSTNLELVNMSVDKKEARVGETLNYEIKVTNGLVDSGLELSMNIPSKLKILQKSLKQEVVGGETRDEFKIENGRLTWSGELNVSDLVLEEGDSPYGYVPLANYTAPLGCPSDNCDDGGISLTVPAFRYNGETYTKVEMSVNGTLEIGSSDGKYTAASVAKFPNSQEPNNLLAPFWTDLNLGVDGDGAEWYATSLNDGTNSYAVYEWNNVPLYGDTSSRYTFQIWIQEGDSGNIWFIYQDISNSDIPLSVGLENKTGTVGDSYYFSGEGSAPQPGTDLKVVSNPGGSATLSFQAKVKSCPKRRKAVIARSYLDSDNGEEMSYAAFKCHWGY